MPRFVCALDDEEELERSERDQRVGNDILSIHDHDTHLGIIRRGVIK